MEQYTFRPQSRPSSPTNSHHHLSRQVRNCQRNSTKQLEEGSSRKVTCSLQDPASSAPECRQLLVGDGSIPHIVLQPDASWGSGPRSVTAPLSTHGFPCTFSCPPAAFVQLPPNYAGDAGRSHTIMCTPSPHSHQIQIHPNNQFGYVPLEHAKGGFPYFQNIYQYPQPLLLQSQPEHCALLGSAPQGITDQPLTLRGVHACQHNGTNQFVQTAALPLQTQLSPVPQSYRLDSMKQFLPFQQATAQQLHVPAQSIQVPAMQPVGVLSPGGVSAPAGLRVNGFTGPQESHQGPPLTPPQVFVDTTTTAGGLPQVALQNFQPGVHNSTYGVSLCPSRCESLYSAYIATPAAPPTLTQNFRSPYTLQQSVPSGALPLSCTSAQQLDVHVGSSSCFMPGANACVAKRATLPSILFLPSNACEPSSFASTSALPSGRNIYSALPSGTHISAIAGAPLSSCQSVGPPTTVLTVGTPPSTQNSSAIHRAPAVLSLLPLGGASVAGEAQLMPADSRTTAYTAAFPSPINVLPSSLGALVAGNTFVRQKPGQPTTNNRQRGLSTQPFVPCCLPSTSKLT